MNDALARKYWGASKGRSAIDCAWLLAASTGSDHGSHKHGVATVVDDSKHYESIPLLALRCKFLRHGAPTCWLKLATNVWASPRVARLGRHRAQKVLFAKYGVPA
eukprot:4525806-Pyramimonas_sp.AAC.1